MDKHLDEGQLRAALDGELDSAELEHLQSCSECQSRQADLRASSARVGNHLAFLDSAAQEPVPAARPALSRFYNQTLRQKEPSMLRKIFAQPVIRVAVAIALLLAIVVAIPSTRALADQLLNLFRVQQITVVPVDFTGMQRLTGNSTFGKQIGQLLSSDVKVEQEPGDVVIAKDAAEASQLTGFSVRLPKEMTPAYISVEKGGSFTYKVDRAKVQALIDEAGRSDLVLPAAIDGADISVTIPSGVSVAFGQCPQPGKETESGGMSPIDAPIYRQCVILAEIPSPTVEAPAGVDVAQLAQIGLEFTGMSREEASAFVKSVDWTTSLVVPIPKNAVTYQQVPVDGVTGTLIIRSPEDAPQYALIWVKDGIIYAIGGLGTNSQKALDMAGSLQ
jgi:hypothetical protein